MIVILKCGVPKGTWSAEWTVAGLFVKGVGRNTTGDHLDREPWATMILPCWDYESVHECYHCTKYSVGNAIKY